MVTEELIEKVYKMIQEGKQKYEIMNELDISQTVVNKIVLILKARGKLPRDFKFKVEGVSRDLNVNKYATRRVLSNIDTVFKMLERGKTVEEIANMYQVPVEYLEFVLDAIEMYKNGMTYHQIAEKYNTTEVRVFRVIKRAIEKGIVEDRNKSKEVVDRVIRLYKQGYTPYKIFKELRNEGVSISFKTVYNIVDKYVKR